MRLGPDGCQVIHGDGLAAMAELGDSSVHLVWTDPPYGHNNNNGDLISRREMVFGRAQEAQTSRQILNDGPEANDLYRAFLPQAFRVLIPGACCCCCCCGGGPDPQFARWSLWMDEVFAFKQMVVWDKGPMGMGWHYRRSYETVLVGQKPGAPCRWYDDTNSVENVIRDVPKIVPTGDQHPTQKPAELAARFILNHTQPGDLVVDPFCGSGSTGVACVRLGRRFLGVELDPHWAGVAERRIASETPCLPGLG